MVKKDNTVLESLYAAYLRSYIILNYFINYFIYYCIFFNIIKKKEVKNCACEI